MTATLMDENTDDDDRDDARTGRIPPEMHVHTCKKGRVQAKIEARNQCVQRGSALDPEFRPRNSASN